MAIPGWGEGANIGVPVAERGAETVPGAEVVTDRRRREIGPEVDTGT